MNLPNGLLALVTDAAKKGGALLKAGYRSHPKAQHKGVIDFVTEFDLASERAVLAELRQSGLPIVAEESGGDAGDGPTFFVDPLDGTTNFLHGHPFFAVSIGLVAKDTPLLGVVYAPALDVLWTAEAHGPQAAWSCLRNGERCSVTETSTLNDALLATGFPYDRRTNPNNNLREFAAIKMQSRGVRRCGSAAIDLALVADGTYDGYWEKRLKPWDLAAGAALVLAAGGKLSALDGSPHDVRTGDLVATNGHLHNALVAAVIAGA